MRDTLIVLDDLLLLACCSMYFGTGWSLILFSVPPKKTVDNYYDQIVPQLVLATRFLTVMTGVMLGAAAVMTISEWHHRLWAPLIVLGGVIAASLLTTLGIFPLNRLLATHIKDPSLLESTLRRWKMLSMVRLAVWTVEVTGDGGLLRTGPRRMTRRGCRRLVCVRRAAAVACGRGAGRHVTGPGVGPVGRQKVNPKGEILR